MASVLPSQWSALVLDPDRRLGAILRDHLNAIGASQVEACQRVEQAFNILDRMRATFVIATAGMTPIDGFEFTRTFRRSATARDPTCPVILTFPQVERRDLLETLNSGAEGVLRYPLSQSSVRSVLEAVTTHRREFVRSKTYVGPCRRRGLATQDDAKKRREADAPLGASQLNVVLGAMERIHHDAHRPEGVSAARSAALTAALQAYFVAIRPDRKEGINIRCESVTAQFVEFARGQADFEAAAAPLRRVLAHAAQAQAAQRAAG